MKHENMFNENRSCIEINFITGNPPRTVSLMKTEVVLKYFCVIC